AARWPAGWDARLNTLLARPGPAYALLAVLAAEGAYIVGAAALGHHAHTDDELTYLFQARLLLSGRLTIPAPPEHAAFMHPFLVEANGRISGQYFWAQSALLALGEALGNPWLVPALEVAVTVYF